MDSYQTHNFRAMAFCVVAPCSLQVITEEHNEPLTTTLSQPITPQEEFLSQQKIPNLNKQFIFLSLYLA
jgi:hypothetical protein